MLFELDASRLQALKSRTNKFTHLAEYPEVEYDISMLFDSELYGTIFMTLSWVKRKPALL